MKQLTDTVELKDIKTEHGSSTLLHYVAKCVEADNPENVHWTNEIPSVNPARRGMPMKVVNSNCINVFPAIDIVQVNLQSLASGRKLLDRELQALPESLVCIMRRSLGYSHVILESFATKQL